MSRNAQGTWLQTDQSEVDSDGKVTITLPEGTPDWTDSTVHIQRIHDTLVAKGWGGYGPS